MKEALGKLGFTSYAFFAAIFCIGAFPEYVSCIIGAAFAAAIFINHLRKSQTVFYLNLTFISLIIITLFYGISTFWATDPGISFIGFMKYVPVLLFAIGLMQTDERRSTLVILPFVTCITVALSVALSFIPLFSDVFVTDGRLGGIFLYPDTYAVFILISQLLLITKPKIKYYDIGAMVILIAGLIYTGSISVIAIGILANVAAILFTRSKKTAFYSFLAVLAAGFALTVYMIAANKSDLFARLIDTDAIINGISERLLYYRDALPLLLKNPFGLGYMGYSFVQPSVQTGIYSTPYVHNDILQLMLDIGWIPALLFLFVIVKRIFSRKTTRQERIVLCALFAHSMIDYDMQFTVIFMVYVLLLDCNAGKKRVVSGLKWLISGVSAILTAVTLYIGVALVLDRVGQNELSYTLYPFNTYTESELLNSTSDTDRVNKIADRMLKRNDHSLLALSAKARYAYANHDYEALIEHKNRIFEIAPFQYEEYEEYARMLISEISYFNTNKNYAAASKCRIELISIQNNLDRLEIKMSKLGKKLSHKTDYTLPDVLVEYITELQK